jgi:hypothetical protein
MPRKKHFLSNAYEYFNTLTMVFYLMVGIPLLFFVILYLQYQEAGGLQVTDNWELIPHVLIPAATVASIVMAYRLYKNTLTQRSPKAFREKLRTFHEVSIYKYGLLDLANFLPVLGMYLTGEQIFAGLYAVTLVVFSLNRPTHSRISKDMDLSQQEQQWLRSDRDFDELP